MAVQPRITYPLFHHEHDVATDVATARLTIHFAMRIAEKLQMSDYPYPSKLPFAPGQDPAALEEWERIAPAEYLSVPPMPLMGQQRTQAALDDKSKSKKT